jgi:putative AbiEii toxin of type IV toxin-antitoxin system
VVQAEPFPAGNGFQPFRNSHGGGSVPLHSPGNPEWYWFGIDGTFGWLPSDSGDRSGSDAALRVSFFEGDPLDGRAMVGIDEIDLHLHPRWQRTVLPQLTKLFPNTQFVVTTHSPIVVQAAIDQNFSMLRLEEKKGGVKAQRLSTTLMKRLRGAEIGSVLFEELGFRSIVNWIRRGIIGSYSKFVKNNNDILFKRTL